MTHGCHSQRSGFIGTPGQLVIFHFHMQAWAWLSISACYHPSASAGGWAARTQGLLRPSLLNLPTSILRLPRPPQRSGAYTGSVPAAPGRSPIFFVHTSQRIQSPEHNHNSVSQKICTHTFFLLQRSVMFPVLVITGNIC